MSEHLTLVRPDAEPGWVAECRCGWASSGHFQKWEAQVAADVHSNRAWPEGWA